MNRADDEIDLHEVLRFLWIRRIFLGCFALLGLAFGCAILFLTWNNGTIFKASYLVPQDAVTLVPALTQRISSQSEFAKTSVEISEEASLKVDKAGAPLKVARFVVNENTLENAAAKIGKTKTAWESLTQNARIPVLTTKAVWEFEKSPQSEKALRELLSESVVTAAATALASDGQLTAEKWIEEIPKRVTLSIDETPKAASDKVTAGFPQNSAPISKAKITVRAVSELEAQKILNALRAAQINSQQGAVQAGSLAVAGAMFQPNPALPQLSSILTSPFLLSQMVKKFDLKNHYRLLSNREAEKILVGRIGLTTQSGAKLSAENLQIGQLFMLTVADSNPQMALKLVNGVTLALRAYLMSDAMPGERSVSVTLADHPILQYMQTWMLLPKTIQTLSRSLRLYEHYAHEYGVLNTLSVESDVRSKIKFTAVDVAGSTRQWALRVSLNDADLSVKLANEILRSMATLSISQLESAVLFPAQGEVWFEGTGVPVEKIVKVTAAWNKKFGPAASSGSYLAKWNGVPGQLNKNDGPAANFGVDQKNISGFWGFVPLDNVPAQAKVSMIRGQFKDLVVASDFASEFRSTFDVAHDNVTSVSDLLPYKPVVINAPAIELPVAPLKYAFEPSLLQEAQPAFVLPESQPVSVLNSSLQSLTFEEWLPIQNDLAATQKLNASKKFIPVGTTLLAIIFGLLISVLQNALKQNPAPTGTTPLPIPVWTGPTKPLRAVQKAPTLVRMRAGASAGTRRSSLARRMIVHSKSSRSESRVI